jgi:4-hydroxybenzoate polyprenyltransferase
MLNFKKPFIIAFGSLYYRIMLGEGGLVLLNIIHSIISFNTLGVFLLESFVSIVLMSALYGFNDYVDRYNDLANEKKKSHFTRLIIQREKTFLTVNIFLSILSVLLIYLFLEKDKLWFILLLFFVNFIYSLKFKSIPFIDIIIVSVWGGLYSVVVGNYFLEFSVLVGLMTGIAHIFQILTDVSSDSKNNIKTSVVFMPGSIFWIFLIISFSSAILVCKISNIFWAISIFFPLCVFYLSKKKVLLSWFFARLCFFTVLIKILLDNYGYLFSV